MKTLSEKEQQLRLPQWAANLEGNHNVKQSGCWDWTGTLDRDGYGSLRGVGAHRASWIVSRGTIPEGLTIDHLCRNKSCVNPDHMEVVSNAENIRRRNRDNPDGIGRPRIPTLKRAGCGSHGKIDGYFVTRPDGYAAYTCRICRRERLAKYKALR